MSAAIDFLIGTIAGAATMLVMVAFYSRRYRRLVEQVRQAVHEATRAAQRAGDEP